MGRPKLAKQRYSMCEGCRKRFGWIWKPYMGNRKRRFCSRRCQAIAMPVHPRKWPDVATLRELFVVRRLSRREISRMFGLNGGGTAIRLALLRHGIIRRNDHGEGNNPPQDPAKVVKMYLSGMSQNAIAKSFPCASSHIRNILLRQGVAIRPRDYSELRKPRKRMFSCPHECAKYHCNHWRVWNAERRNKQYAENKAKRGT
jgi:hypothetical protein